MAPDVRRALLKGSWEEFTRSCHIEVAWNCDHQRPMTEILEIRMTREACEHFFEPEEAKAFLSASPYLFGIVKVPTNDSRPKFQRSSDGTPLIRGRIAQNSASRYWQRAEWQRAEQCIGLGLKW